MKKILNVITANLIFILLACLWNASCNDNNVGTETTTDSTKSLETQILENFSKKELYKELEARSRKADKGIITDTIPLDGRLKQFSDKALYEVIYDVDDRKNLYEINDAMVINDSKKAACLIMKSQLSRNSDGTFTIKSKGNFMSINGLCSDERFSKEPVSAFCSGFAISKDVFVTAGHCVKENNLSEFVIVYGYQISKQDSVNIVINQSDIFHPVSIIKRELDVTTKNDFCLLRVNKEFQPDRIANIRRNNKISDNEAVHVIGYPCGLPLKVTPNANVFKNNFSNYFVTNLDTYGGNSGSPVFNSQTHTVEGILVRGNQDFEIIDIDNCKRSFHCPRNIGNCDGEDVSRVSQFWPWLE